MTLLTCINDAQALLNLAQTTTVISNTSDGVKQLLALANTEGRALARKHPWQRLTTERTFTTVATEQQTGETLPTDLGWIVNETLYNRSTTQQVLGPLSSRTWQEQKALGTSLTWSQYRLRGNSFYFLPAPSASQTIAYEYISKFWCESSGGTARERWAADDDVGKIDEYVMTLGIVWRWNKSKGHAYEQDYQDYVEARSEAISRDGTRRTLNMGGPARVRLSVGNISEGNW